MATGVPLLLLLSLQPKRYVGKSTTAKILKHWFTFMRRYSLFIFMLPEV
jgi:hypothetical protein